MTRYVVRASSGALCGWLGALLAGDSPADTVGTVITVTATIHGEEVRGEVAGGQLVGSPALVERVEELIAQRRHVGLGNMAGTASLDDDRLARFTLLAACDRDSCRLGGDPPRVDRVPVDAEA